MTASEQQSRNRRPKGTGAIKRRASDGQYRGSKVIDGRRVYTPWYPTESMVEEALAVLRPREIVPPGRTLDDAFRAWMAEAVIAATTRGGYETSWRNYARPFAHRDVREVTREEVSAHYRAMEREGRALSTIRGASAVLRGAFAYAHDAGWIAHNPIVGMKLPSAPRAVITEITGDDRERILEALRGHRYEARYRLSLVFMMRPAEALGLRWSSVDLNNGTLQVTGQLQRVTAAVTLDGRTGPLGTVYRHETKSRRGLRTLWMDDQTSDALRLWQEVQAGERAGHTDTDYQLARRELQSRRLAAAREQGVLKKGSYAVPPRDLVFTLRNGDPLLERKDNDEWRELLRSLGIPPNRRYATRHSAVNHLLTSGAPIDEISAAAGHASSAFTERQYGGDRSMRGRSLRDYV